ncbi:hypothetical protein, partial [Paenibacillus sp. sgz302251]|uniref:hypothetical protein n=1 Tax=Paenibacillus sp. sgz302251 TaxID=3414493 RepID=UPI003C7D8205
FFHQSVRIHEAVLLVVQFSKSNLFFLAVRVCLSGDFYNISQMPKLMQAIFLNLFLKLVHLLMGRELM